MNVRPTKIRLIVSSMLWALILIMSPLLANAEAITVSGEVTDTEGEPLIGVTVAVKGTSKGTSTDIDGHYTLTNVESDAVLTFSYVGYNAVEQKVAGRTNINVKLTEDNKMLSEVVVVGYGSLNKKEVTSSIVQVNREDFQQGAMNNPMEMLTGKVAGLNVNTTAAANPNGSSDLQIRGATSINAGNGPLIVIDGVAGGDIRTLAPQDIESMSVLKDAASAAIYGTRGANGVILITTKKGTGEAGRPSVTYDSYISMAFAKDKPEVLSPDEWRRARRGNDYGYATDWYDLITRKTAYDTNQYVSIDGSLPAGGYYSASMNYKRANGLDLTAQREEFGGRAAVSANTLDSHLRITTTLNARRVNEIYGDDGMFDTALGMNPTLPVYNEDGSFYQPTSPTDVRNPVQQLTVNSARGVRTYILGTADAKYDIWHNDKHGVSTTLSYSFNYNNYENDYYTPSTSGESFWGGYAGRANIDYNKWWTNRLEWIFNYNFKSYEHDVKFVGGYAYERSDWEGNGMSNSDFTYDNPLWWGIGTGSYLADGKATMWAGKSQSTLIGFFGRANYAWRNLLFAAASIRYEGSTKFGADKKWGAFPSVSVGWEIAQMPFILDTHPEVVQSLKLRAAYGETGRSDFDAYQSAPTYTSRGKYFMDGAWINGYAPAINANPLLGWEKSTSFNIGVDFMLWNRLNGSIEYFDRRSKDLLYNYTAPQPPYVYDNILVNVGTIKNTGVELVLNYDVFKGTPVTWTTGINYSYSTSKLTKLSNDVYQASYLDLYLKPGVGTSEYFFRVQEGGKIGQFYGYEYAGHTETGDMLVYNADGEPILATTANANDKRYIGNGAPEHFLTWSNTLTWNNFDLNIMFRGAFGFDIFNMRKYGMGLKGSGSDNVLRSAYLEDSDLSSGTGVISSYFLEKGDFFKLDNITLGYTVPLKKSWLVENLRVYLSAKNLFTITKYSGTDPASVSQTGITPGIDVTSAYPSATQLALGVTLKFR